MVARTCPHPECAELNEPDAIWCETCGTRLIPSQASIGRTSIEQWRRLQGAVGHVAEYSDPGKRIDRNQYVQSVIDMLDQQAKRKHR